MKLTKRSVDALRPREVEFTAWDDALSGFGCRVHPTGRKIFIFKYRVGGGRSAAQRKMMLGAFGPITVDQARKLALHAQAEVAKGGDPAGIFTTSIGSTLPSFTSRVALADVMTFVRIKDALETMGFAYDHGMEGGKSRRRFIQFRLITEE